MSVSEQNFGSTAEELYLPNETQTRLPRSYKLYALVVIAVTLAWHAFLIYGAWRFVVWAVTLTLR